LRGIVFTQLIKVRQGHRIAQADARLAVAQLCKGENEVLFNVQQFCFALLVVWASTCSENRSGSVKTSLRWAPFKMP
jgi:hypothetical protein